MDSQDSLYGITLNVNGCDRYVEVTQDETLLDTVRQRLGLKGTKRGCDDGSCGGCTVIVNGAARKSCKLKTSQLEGAAILTIEGLADGQGLHPLQQAFIDEGAVACGFCTPGMVLAAYALLLRNPSPSEEDIKRALQSNLCRCTGYWSIIRAVQRVSGQSPAPPVPESSRPSDFRVVGWDIPRHDATAKVTGQPIFADDLEIPGAAHAVLVRSPHPHAQITGINVDEAQQHPGVYAVFTAADIPGLNAFGKTVADQPVLAADRVSYVGQPVAVVVGETYDLAVEAVSKVAVDYKPLPAVLSPEESLASGSPDALLHRIELTRGDVDAGFQGAAIEVEAEFRTQRTDPAFLEPPAGIAYIDEDDRIVVYAACQYPYGLRRQIAAVLGLPEERIRLVLPVCGGAFGGKVEASVQIHLALIAWKLRRPVKMVWTRAETLLGTVKRHPMVMRYRVGASADGHLTAMDVEILADTGAFETSGKAVLLHACHCATGPYEIPNVRIVGHSCRTNHVPSGPQRGFGVLQVNFAHESILDMLAARLGITPLEIRTRNVLKTGDRLASSQKLTEEVSAERTLHAVLPKEPLSESAKQRGSGLALAFKSVGYSGGNNEARARIEIDAEGNAVVRTGGIEMGQGSEIMLAQIAAEELHLEIDRVRVAPVDTYDELDSGSTEASRQTLAVGSAVLDGCCDLRALLICEASQQLGIAESDLALEGGKVSAPEQGETVSYQELAEWCASQGRRLAAKATVSLPVPGQTRRADGSVISAVDLSYSAARAEVEVDINTGRIDILALTVAQDVGVVINPRGIESQVEGGAVMGLGFAMLEDFSIVEGVPGDLRLASYRAPRMRDLPTFQSVVVECPGAVGPYGARGVGELSTIPIAAAISNAIHDAVGVRLFKLPINRSIEPRLIAEEADGNAF